MWITKKQFRGVWYLGILIMAVAAAIQLLNHHFLSKNIQRSEVSDSLLLDSLLVEIKLRQESEKENFRNTTQKENSFETKSPEELILNLHPFDPNTISRPEWLAMNLPEKVFNGLERYRSKGGRIKKPEAILKLYNLDETIGKQLIPFIKLDSSLYSKPKIELKKFKAFPEKPKYKPFDLNQADTTQLMSVYGIGRGIANRMIRHRNSLGGFISKKYVYDVFGLDSSVVEELFLKAYISENPDITKTKINTLSEEELAKNPYIRKGFARIIVKYRNQHGPFKKPEDLLEIKILTPEWLEKLKPYLEF
jgi:competence protein ComEA